MFEKRYRFDTQKGNQINQPDTESTNSPLMNSLVNFTLTGICPFPAAAMDGEQEELLVIIYSEKGQTTLDGFFTEE